MIKELETLAVLKQESDALLARINESNENSKQEVADLVAKMKPVIEADMKEIISYIEKLEASNENFGCIVKESDGSYNSHVMNFSYYSKGWQVGFSTSGFNYINEYGIHYIAKEDILRWDKNDSRISPDTIYICENWSAVKQLIIDEIQSRTKKRMETSVKNSIERLQENTTHAVGLSDSIAENKEEL